MARLSAEHFRAKAANSPDGSHKSNRLRDIFKMRSSMSSNSEGDQKTAKSSKNAAMSSTVKPGFEQVGILPNERASLVPEPTDHTDSGTPIGETSASKIADDSVDKKPNKITEAPEALKNKVELSNEASKGEPQDNNNNSATADRPQKEERPATENAENRDEPHASDASNKTPSFIAAEEAEPVFESPFALGLASELDGGYFNVPVSWRQASNILTDNAARNNGVGADDSRPRARQVSNIPAGASVQNHTGSARANARSQTARHVSHATAVDPGQDSGARADARRPRVPRNPHVPTIWEYIERRIVETLANQDRARAEGIPNTNLRIVLNVDLNLPRRRVASGGDLVSWLRCIGVAGLIGVLAHLLGHDVLMTVMGYLSIILTAYWLTVSLEIQN